MIVSQSARHVIVLCCDWLIKTAFLGGFMSRRAPVWRGCVAFLIHPRLRIRKRTCRIRQCIFFIELCHQTRVQARALNFQIRDSDFSYTRLSYTIPWVYSSCIYLLTACRRLKAHSTVPHLLGGETYCDLCSCATQK